jgi:hypothetical protein
MHFFGHARVQGNAAQEVKSLRLEVTALQETLEESRSITKADGAKVIDLPSRKAN